MITRITIKHIQGLPIMTNAIDTTEDNSVEASWEELFHEVIDNKNLSVKDVETAKYIFFKGVEAAMNLSENVGRSDIKEEINDYLYEDEEEDHSSIFMPSPDQKDTNGQTHS